MSIDNLMPVWVWGTFLVTLLSSILCAIIDIFILNLKKAKTIRSNDLIEYIQASIILLFLLIGDLIGKVKIYLEKQKGA